ncbi:cerebrin prohormone-like [Babylonia areolata]|uniref:cerebrin prohormone-like n=1 Tax=Babylonia areolata TaxID=304850 RepID=UPI003FD4889B
MLSFSKVTLLVTLMALMVTWVAHETQATPLALRSAVLKERVRQEIISMASNIIRLAQSGGSLGSGSSKRNGGTLDTLYNLPNLSDIGRR